MRALTVMIFLVILSGCGKKETGKTMHKDTTQAFSSLLVKNADFPLSLTEVNVAPGKNAEPCNDMMRQKIIGVIRDFYYNDCSGDSSQTYFSVQDTYIGTIRLHDSIHSVYMVLLNYPVGGDVNSKVLFYNRPNNAFAGSIDFNIHALYDFDHGRLETTNLKKLFKIKTPEIELVDHNHDGINDFKFTRLYHNGTANAIETAIIQVSHGQIDTLHFKKRWIRSGNR